VGELSDVRQLDLDIALETYVKVLGVNVAVLGLVEVLLGDEHTLAEEVLVDRFAVGLGDQPGALSVCSNFAECAHTFYSHFGSGYWWLVGWWRG
jgi:hypothetical protein